VIVEELSEAKGQGYGSKASSHHDLVPQFFQEITLLISKFNIPHNKNIAPVVPKQVI